MASTEYQETLHGELADKETETHLLEVGQGGELALEFMHPGGPGDNGVPIELRLFDAAGNDIARLITRGNTTLHATVPGKGSYHLSVRDADSSSEPPGTYMLVSTFRNTDKTVYDGGANNNTPNAIYLPLDHVARGRMEARDTDVFMIEPDAAGRLRLQFSHANGQGTNGNLIRVHLTDAHANTLVTASMRGDQVLETTVVGAGKYYVSLTQMLGSPDKGLYTLAPVFDTYKGVIYDSAANDKAAEAQSLPLGRTAIGRMGPLDTDFYRFEASSGGKFSLNFGHPHGAGVAGSAITVEIADSSSGQGLVTRVERGSDLLSVDLPNGGTYTVRLSNPSGNEVQGYYSVMHGLANNGGKTIVLSSAGDFAGTAGNDVVHGSHGRDILTLAGKAGEHKVAIYPAGATVQDPQGRAGLDTLFNVERIRFDDTMMALDIQGVGGQAFRLYEAAFGRPSDAAGLGFWIYQLDNGMPLKSVADGFIRSREFEDTHGRNLDNEAFVEALYENVLDRDPDGAGIDFWVRQLEQGQVDRADVLIAMANSDENVAKLVGTMMDGMEYLAWRG